MRLAGRFLVFVAAMAGIALVVGIIWVAGNGPSDMNSGEAPEGKSLAGPTPTPTQPTDRAQIRALVNGLPAESVAVAARNLSTGARFAFGSSGGQTTASVAKVDIAETLLLQHQDDDDPLSSTEDDAATSMIEESDDDAATYLYEDVGAAAGVANANQTLGVPCTAMGQNLYWGLTTTCARGQVQLLDQLENTGSPLDATSRSYITDLVENVAPSEEWGVPVIADAGSSFAVKDGWLNLQGDTDWAINSMGILAYHGQTLLIAILTQNNTTENSGITLVQELAALAAQSVSHG